jgi:signal transduction histidine kinase
VRLSTACCDGDHVRVRLKDNGVRIAREDLQRVFEMFTQVGRSTEQSRDGLGVGLALSQWLVRLHGGMITAHSEGRGHVAARCRVARYRPAGPQRL